MFFINNLILTIEQNLSFLRCVTGLVIFQVIWESLPKWLHDIVQFILNVQF